MPTVLLVEDNDNLRLLLTKRLKKDYRVLDAIDGLEALECLEKEKVDLLITDIAMPRMDGFELLRILRERGNSLPILMLTANNSFRAKRSGFAIGTDDYLTKPFDCEELLWRVRALFRRSTIETDRKVEAGNITADLSSYTVKYGDESYSLPRKEFELLFKLLSNPGRIYTRKQLFDDIWGNCSASSEETIKTHISRLRSKIRNIQNLSITAVKGIGYKAVIENP